MASPVDRPALWHPPRHESEEDSDDPITCDEFLAPLPRASRSPLPLWIAGLGVLMFLSLLLWLV